MSLTVYCDASGTEDTDCRSVGGFIADDNDWTIFDREWSNALKEFGLSYFRMSEFAQSVGQFARWRGQESMRRALLDRLVRSIIPHPQHWSGAAIMKEPYQRVDKDYELHEYAQRYPICGAMCIVKMRQWYDAHHLDVPIEYVFEKGDEHVGQ